MIEKYTKKISMTVKKKCKLNKIIFKLYFNEGNKFKKFRNEYN